MKLPLFLSWIVVFLLCLAGLSLIAQHPNIRTYTVDDGLVMNRIRGFHQDQQGFIWMYTWDGLSRLEGYRFRNYIAGKHLAHGLINDIMEYPDGTMYVALNDGTMEIIRNQEVMTLERLHGDVINSFFEDKTGAIYATTDYRGICLFDHGILHPRSEKKSNLPVMEAVEFHDQYYFIGPYGGPSGVYDDELNLTDAWKGSAGYFNCIYRDKKDRILVGTRGGLKEVKSTLPGNHTLMDASIVPTNAKWKNSIINAVIQSAAGEYWIGTNQGLIRILPDKSWSILSVNDGLLSNQINALFIDRSGTLWIGTDAGAASINLQNQITNMYNWPGKYANYMVSCDDGTIYALTGNSFLNRLDSKGNLLQSEHLGNSRYPAVALIPTEDKLLLIRPSLMEILNPNKFPASISNGPHSTITYLFWKGIFWMTSDAGFHWAAKPGRTVPVSCFPYRVEALAVDHQDHLLIGTIKDGLYVMEQGKVKSNCNLDMICDLNAWITDKNIRSLMVSKKGDIWIGTRFGGVFVLHCNEDYTSAVVHSFSISDGLISNWITSIAEDPNGNIWVGSVSGIDKLIPDGDTYRLFSFSRVNGYYGNTKQVLVNTDSSVWVANTEGISRLVDGQIDTIPPTFTYLTEVYLGGQEISATSPFYPHLPYTRNSVHFAFSAPDFINASQLRFIYRLMGSKDTTWSEPVKTNEIFYANLHPGKFQFEVAALGWNGERGKPGRFAFEIERPFWKQWWFVSLGFSMLFLSMYAVYRMRIAQIEKVQLVRDRIAEDLHDEIGSSLTHVNILSEIGRQQSEDSQAVAGIFNRIGNEAQSSSEALDDIIWSVKTRRDSIGDVVARMRQYGTELFEPANISFQLHESLEGIQMLEMEFKRDLYLIFKELLRNVIRHANASHVDIQITSDRTSIRISIRDNGKGFNPMTPTDRNGISNIKSRVMKWRGSAIWESHPDEGTVVNIEMRP